MKRTENVELTTLCMVTDGDRILLQNRVKEDWQGFTFPGGHVEHGESFVDAVIREIKEETGLTVISPKLAGIKQFPIEGGRYIVLLFKATQYEGKILGLASNPKEADLRTVVWDLTRCGKRKCSMRCCCTLSLKSGLFQYLRHYPFEFLFI